MANPTDEARVPKPEEYLSVLRSAKVNEIQRRMLQVHYRAPNRTITAAQMARTLGFGHYNAANLHYGKLGRQVREMLGAAADSIDQRLGMLVTFEKRHDEWHWIMRPQVAYALESLGWVEPVLVAPALPEEIMGADATRLIEGASTRVLVNAYERSSVARRRCLEVHGSTCCICRFDFGETYGTVAKGYIHVHHLRPLSEIGDAYVVNPVEDLRPVCPNCHAVLHLRAPAFTLDEVRTLLCLPDSPNNDMQRMTRHAADDAKCNTPKD